MEAIEKAIEQVGSGAALAELMGWHASFVSQIRTGRRRVPADRCEDLADATGIPAHQFRPDVFRAPETDPAA